MQRAGALLPPRGTDGGVGSRREHGSASRSCAGAGGGKERSAESAAPAGQIPFASREKPQGMKAWTKQYMEWIKHPELLVVPAPVRMSQFSPSSADRELASSVGALYVKSAYPDCSGTIEV